MIDKTFLIVIGVHKAGTTSFYEYLRGLDQIFTPLKKELHFFTPLVYDNKVVLDNLKYL
jgi:hypothetical protein